MTLTQGMGAPTVWGQELVSDTEVVGKMSGWTDSGTDDTTGSGW